MREEGAAVKLHYAGKYDLNPASLPSGPHRPGAVPFREAQDSGELSRLCTRLSLLLLLALGGLLVLRCGAGAVLRGALWGFLLSLLFLFPHELLHALCFRQDVYLYTNLQQGMLFVVGPEEMSRGRFVFMSLLPNLLFGFLPFLFAMAAPAHTVLGVLGASCISMGVGDYYNVYHALTQMPKGARTYMHGFNSFWYLPQGTAQGPAR